MIPWQAYLDVALTLSVVLALAPVLGRYMARVYTDRPTLLDGLLGPVDRALFRLLGVSRREEMGWKEYAANLLLLNAIALVGRLP
ncbi:ATPase, K+ transporting, A subunit, partial [mine drainage metagenome]